MLDQFRAGSDPIRTDKEQARAIWGLKQNTIWIQTGQNGKGLDPSRTRTEAGQRPCWAGSVHIRINSGSCLDRSWTDRRHIGHTQEDPPTDEEGEWAAEDSEGEDDETNSEEEEEVEEGDEDAQVSESSPTR